MVGIETGWSSLGIEGDGAALGMATTDYAHAPLFVTGELCGGPSLAIGPFGFGDLSARVLERRADEPLDALAVSHDDHRPVSWAEVGRRDTKTHRAADRNPGH